MNDITKAIRIERMKFLLWLQGRYLVCSGDKYRITTDDFNEIKNGIKVDPEWESLPMYQAVMNGEEWGISGDTKEL